MILCLFLEPVYDYYYFFPLWINIYLGIVPILAVQVAYLYHHASILSLNDRNIHQFSTTQTSNI